MLTILRIEIKVDVWELAKRVHPMLPTQRLALLL